MKMTLSILCERQAWPLDAKIDHTLGAIDAFLAYCREHDRKPYVSFSGGLNSTVLLHLARRIFGQDFKGVFCSTGNEFPEIVRFVRHTPNVEIIHPALTPRQVMEQYGFPLVSKEQAQAVRNIRTTKSEKLRNYRLHGDGVRRPGVLQCYVLIGYPGDTQEKALAWRAGFLPFAMLYRDRTGDFNKEWRRFQGEWANHKIVPCNCKKYFDK